MTMKKVRIAGYAMIQIATIVVPWFILVIVEET